MISDYFGVDAAGVHCWRLCDDPVHESDVDSGRDLYVVRVLPGVQQVRAVHYAVLHAVLGREVMNGAE